MNDGKLVFDVTHVRGFAEDLWHRMADDGEWGKEIKEAIKLITGHDGGGDENSGGRDGTSDGSGDLATVGTSGHEYYGKSVGEHQAENLQALVTFARKARSSVRDLAKGAAVMSEKTDGQDSANGKDVEQVYSDFGESAPHGLYGGQ